VIWNGTERKTVFLLGAGATRGAFTHVRVNHKKIVAPLNFDFFNIAKAFANAQQDDGFRHRFERIRKVFREEFPTRGRWPIPMEEAFSLLFVSKEFPGIYARRGRKRAAGTRQEIEDFLRLTFGILSAIEEKVSALNLYARLAGGLSAGDTILSLNYDTLLDSMLVNQGWNPTVGYGLEGGTGKVVWHRDKPTLSPRLSGVKLLKLHGSLNWYVKGSFEKLEKIFAAKPSKVLIQARPRTNEMDGYVRQIIPPIYGKFFAHSHWQTLWQKAHKAVMEAEAFVVIGCSLAVTDFHLSGMLGNAIKRRKADGNKFEVVAAVDRGLPVRRKWLGLVRGCVSRQYQFNSFEKFAKKHL